MKKYTAYHPSPLGSIRMECSDNFLLAAVFSDSVGENEAHKILEECSKQLDEYFAGRRQAFTLPLGQQGTNFQQKVWELLLQVPYGRTLSYHELSVRYGDVKAIRAVAAANGKNNLAIIVPCHRIIGSNQSLTGYAGGLWRKKWLLDHEAKYYHGTEQASLFNMD